MLRASVSTGFVFIRAVHTKSLHGRKVNATRTVRHKSHSNSGYKCGASHFTNIICFPALFFAIHV
jgi:hypothetical protein